MGPGTFAPRFKQSVTVVTIKYKTPCFFSTFFLVVCRKFCNFAGRQTNDKNSKDYEPHKPTIHRRSRRLTAGKRPPPQQPWGQGHLGHSSRHTQVPVPATSSVIRGTARPLVACYQQDARTLRDCTHLDVDVKELLVSSKQDNNLHIQLQILLRGCTFSS